MSRKFLTPIDLSGLELQNAVIQNLASAPAAAKGRLFFDSVGNVLKVSLDGSTFSTLSTGAGSFTLGSTLISLGSTTTTIAGLTSVTSTTFVGALSGNATTATTLATARAINGVNFDGSAAITVTAAAGTLTGTTLNSTVVSSSLTSVGTLTTLTTSGDVTVGGNLTVNGTTTTVNSTTVTVDDKNIELGSVTTPTDTTADGGGITLKGATDKTFNWINATSAWTSSEHLSLATGKAYYINGTSVLNATTLGSAVVNSSLTKVGLSSAGFVKSDVSGNLTVDTNTYLTSSTGVTTINGVSGAITGVAKKTSGTNTLGTSFSVIHAFGQWVHAQIFDSTTGALVECDVTNTATSGGTTTFTFATSQTAGAYTYVIIG